MRDYRIAILNKYIHMHLNTVITENSRLHSGSGGSRGRGECDSGDVNQMWNRKGKT